MERDVARFKRANKKNSTGCARAGSRMKKEINLKAKVFLPDKLLVYEAGAVVSRTIIKKETGNVTLFSFDKNQGLSEHTASFDALIYILEGKVKIFIAKRGYVLSKGQMIILPANKPHSLKAISKFKMMLVMVKSN